jgi:hypothetical protein
VGTSRRALRTRSAESRPWAPLKRAGPGALALTVRDETSLHRLEHVVVSHLACFAWREPPAIT